MIVLVIGDHPDCPGDVGAVPGVCAQRPHLLAGALLGDPVGAENLCHQAIFMNHAPCAVTPLNPELIQVGHAIG